MTLARGIASGEYYHVYNRGSRRAALFKESRDYVRMLFYITHYQSPHPVPHPARYIDTFDSFGFQTKDDDFASIVAARSVELVAFCLMSNHVHLLVREIVDGGIERYLQRIGTAYTKYYQTKYTASGHIFESRYKAKHVPNNEYLTHLSAYIHRNPAEIARWKTKYFDYPWLSLQDYVMENRWGGLLAPEIILDQFEGTPSSNYADYIKTSPAKAGLE